MFKMMGLFVLVAALAAVALCVAPPPPSQLNCLACLECAKEAGSVIGCLETCQRHRLPLAACRDTCSRLAAPGSSCASLGLCPRTRAEAHEHERRVFGVHAKPDGEPAVVLS